MTKNIVLHRLMLGFVLAMSLAAASCMAQPASPSPEPLSNFPQAALNILTPGARQHHFQVWVADTDAHRQQGLMFVKSLSDSAGMLFIFEQPRKIQMWMKNTLIPLDMLFIDADGRVESIAVNTTPMSLQIIESKSAVLGVLELAGGATTRLGIQAGAVVRHPAFASMGGTR